MLAPVGHGLWTAIVGGALFAASRGGRLRLSWVVLGSYLLVALFHGLWDSMELIATLLMRLYFAVPTLNDLLFGMSRPPFVDQIITYLAFYLGGLVLRSLAGLVLLRWQWRSNAPSTVAQPAMS